MANICIFTLTLIGFWIHVVVGYKYIRYPIKEHIELSQSVDNSPIPLKDKRHIDIPPSARHRRSPTDDGYTDLSGSTADTRNCINQEKNVKGKCVHYTYCNSEHELLDDNVDLRKGECKGLYDWCCYNVSDTTHLDERSPEVCVKGSMKEESCSWCAALYRKEGNPNTMNQKGFFCAGAVVGRRAVLTAATCVLSSMDQQITVHIQEKEYIVKRAITHLFCNSGSKKYDVAILELLDNVEGDIACIASSNEDDDCFSPGFGPDTDYEFHDTVQQTKVLQVTKGRCAKNSSPPGAVCAKIDNDCRLSVGSPVLCAGQIVGVASSRGCSRIRSLGGVDTTSLLDSAVVSWVDSTLKALSASSTTGPSSDWQSKCSS